MSYSYSATEFKLQRFFNMLSCVELHFAKVPSLKPCECPSI